LTQPRHAKIGPSARPPRQMRETCLFLPEFWQLTQLLVGV